MTAEIIKTSFSQRLGKVIPGHVPPELVCDFNVFDSPLYKDDPQAGFKVLQQSAPPLFYTPQIGGHWVITSSDYIREALQTPANFSNLSVQLPKGATFPYPMYPAECDEPIHSKYRKLLNEPLGPGAVAKMADSLRDAISTLTSSVLPKGRCEFVSEIARKFPVRAFLKLYGLPLEDGDLLVGWAHMMFHDGDFERRAEGARNTFEYLKDTVKERRANPREDLITVLVHSQIDGAPIELDALLGLIFTVLQAGLDTVAETMSYIARHLAQNPKARRALIETPTLIPAAIEEYLRRFSPVYVTRIAIKDFQFKGIQIKEGDQFLLPINLMGLDEKHMSNPLEVDFNRKIRVNAAFGGGVHRCAGSHLAKLELRIFIEEWLRQIPEFEIEPNAQIRAGVGSTVLFLENVPLVWNVENV